MAFCRYCGRKLEDNELCGCPQSIAAAEANGAQPTPQPAPQYIPPQAAVPKVSANDFTKSASGAWQAFLNIMKKPVDGCVEFVKKADAVSAVIMIVAQSLLYAVIAFIVANDVWEKEAFKVALITLLLSVVYAAAYAGIMTGALMIAKSKTDYVKALCITAVKRIPCMLAFVVSLLLYLLEIDWFAGPVIIAVGLGLLFVNAALDAVEDVEKNVKTYLFAAVTAVAGIVLYVVYGEVLTDFMKMIVSSCVGKLF